MFQEIAQSQWRLRRLVLEEVKWQSSSLQQGKAVRDEPRQASRIQVMQDPVGYRKDFSCHLKSNRKLLKNFKYGYDTVGNVWKGHFGVYFWKAE